MQLSVVFDAESTERVARFWADLLGRQVIEGPAGVLLPGDETQLDLAPSRSQKAGPNRMHVHLTSESLDDQEHTVEKALGLGARHLDVGQRPEEGHVVLADPEDNEFCVIEPDNGYLVGCGFLGELACDGSREVGLFWSTALGWPVVWEQDEETAIQAPEGGTKVAWGGPPLEPRTARSRQRFHLETDDLDDAVRRLLDVGATHVPAGGDGVAMTDPDGNEFSMGAPVLVVRPAPKGQKRATS